MTNRSLGVIALCIWFLLFALFSLTNLEFVGEQLVMGFLAVGVAVLIFVGK